MDDGSLRIRRSSESMIFVGSEVLSNFFRVSLYEFVNRQLLLIRFHASSLAYYSMHALAHISSTIYSILHIYRNVTTGNGK